jgi:hypothetical protein
MIRLHIEELVLHGFDPRDRHAIGDAVRSELAAVLAERHVSQSASVRLIDGGEVRAGSIRETKPIGHAVANAVRGGLPR